LEHIQQILGNNDVILDESLSWKWKYSRHLHFLFYCSNRLLQKNIIHPLSFEAEMCTATDLFCHLGVITSITDYYVIIQQSDMKHFKWVLCAKRQLSQGRTE